jgi:hypothetical protein
MTRTVPRDVPPIVLETAARAARKLEERAGAYDAAVARHAAWIRASVGDKPAAQAQTLYRWFAELRSRLVPFGFSRHVPSWTVPVACHRITIRAGDGPTEAVVTRLDLCLDDGRFVDHYEWLGDVRVRHGGMLGSPSAFLHALHPEMLRQIHDLAAEGQLWDRVVKGIEALAHDLKDR